MQSLKDKLLNAGVITEDDVEAAKAREAETRRKLKQEKLKKLAKDIDPKDRLN